MMPLPKLLHELSSMSTWMIGSRSILRIRFARAAIEDPDMLAVGVGFDGADNAEFSGRRACPS